MVVVKYNILVRLVLSHATVVLVGLTYSGPDVSHSSKAASYSRQEQEIWKCAF